MRGAFGVRRIAFGVRRSAFGVFLISDIIWYCCRFVEGVCSLPRAAFNAKHSFCCRFTANAHVPISAAFNAERRTPNAVRSICLLALSLSLVASEPSVRAVDAWARATSPSAEIGVAYATLINDGDTEDAVVSVSSDACAEAELHTHVKDAQGLLHMEPVDRIVVPAHGRVVLQPGGLHIMLMELKQQLKPGAPLTLEIHWGSGVQSHVAGIVMDVSASGPPTSDTTHK